MSDTEKPEATPAQPPAQAAESAPPQAPAPEAAPPPQAPAPGGKPGGPGRPGDRPRRGGRPQGSTPRNIPVPDLTREMAFGRAPSLHDLDKEIEGDLEAALAGISEKDLLGGEAA